MNLKFKVNAAKQSKNLLTARDDRFEITAGVRNSFVRKACFLLLLTDVTYLTHLSISPDSRLQSMSEIRCCTKKTDEQYPDLLISSSHAERLVLQPLLQPSHTTVRCTTTLRYGPFPANVFKTKTVFDTSLYVKAASLPR
jgi:hypothetical protein